MQFDRSRRLITRKDFEAVFKAARDFSQGRTIRSAQYVVYLRRTKDRPRLGISIPKKVVRKANKRNRMKRCLREYFRLHQGEFSGDIVVRWLKAPEKMDFDTLTKPLKKLVEYKD